MAMWRAEVTCPTTTYANIFTFFLVEILKLTNNHDNKNNSANTTTTTTTTSTTTTTAAAAATTTTTTTNITTMTILIQTAFQKGLWVNNL
jgi:hypothetical protein